MYFEEFSGRREPYRYGDDPREIALTFDDGPNEPYTLQILELLKKHQAKATFFAVGKFVRQRPDVVREIVRAGHAVGNHSDTHRDLSVLSVAEIRRELEACREAIEGTTGVSCTLFRAPFGLFVGNVLSIAREMGLRTIQWSVMAGDSHPDVRVEEMVHRATTAIDTEEKGQIICFHDGGYAKFGADRSRTVEATRILLERYAGRRFVAIA